MVLDGDHDWMDYEAALKAAKKMNVPTEVCLVAAAGHHLHVGTSLCFLSVASNL